MRIFRTALVAAAASSMLLAGVAHADEATVPAGDLHAFAVGPDNSTCTPGYVHINHAVGVEWTVDGLPVEVGQPASEFAFPDGLQSDATATALPGYHIDPGVRSEFLFTIFPLSPDCRDGVPGDPEPEPVDEHVSVIEHLTVVIKGLQAKVSSLTETIQRKDATIERQQATIDRLRASRPTARQVAKVLDHCLYEDSSNCVWWAGKQGNGKGTSFIDLGGKTYSFASRH